MHVFLKSFVIGFFGGMSALAPIPVVEWIGTQIVTEAERRAEVEASWPICEQHYSLSSEIGLVGCLIAVDNTKYRVLFKPCFGKAQWLAPSRLAPTANDCSQGGYNGHY